jgi:hypothetical protein
MGVIKALNATFWSGDRCEIEFRMNTDVRETIVFVMSEPHKVNFDFNNIVITRPAAVEGTYEPSKHADVSNLEVEIVAEVDNDVINVVIKLPNHGGEIPFTKVPPA